jgi:putative oxidoreductase
MRLGSAVLRVTVGGLFIGHGLQKVAGWFGGTGLEGTGESFERMGLRPGRPHAAAAGIGETVGGALVAGGLLTPLGAAVLSGSMITAIRKMHVSRGPWVTDGGYEYNLVLLAGLFALCDAGPGGLSLDEALGTRRAGPLWALAELAAGAAGSSAALALMGEREAEEQTAPESPDQPDGAERPEETGEQPGGAGHPDGASEPDASREHDVPAEPERPESRTAPRDGQPVGTSPAPAHSR